MFAVALILVAALAPIPAGAQADITEKYRITTGSADPQKPFEAFDTTNIGVFDLNGDGVKEIIAHNDNNNVYVFDGRDGGLVAELTTNHPSWWRTRELAGIAIGDVDGNGRIDLIVTNSAGFVTAFETRTGEGGMHFVKLWERFLDPTEEEPDYEANHPWIDWNGRPGLDGAAYLADARGNGGDEIFLQLDDDPGLYALNGDGSTYGFNSWSEGNANPIATDLTGDGKIEVAYPSDGGRIFIFKGADFRVHCSFNAKAHGVQPGSISVAPTAVDLTGDGRKELVFGTRQAVEDKDDPEWYNKQHANFFAIRSDCSVLWQKSFDWGNPHNHMHPIPVDVDGDGELDVVFQDWNTIGHKPGNWQITGRPNLFALKGSSGELIWHVETSGFYSNSNVALADVTGDGKQELLVVAEQGGRDGVKRYSLSGEALGHIAAPSGWVVNRGPAVADLDGDGKMELIVPVMRGSDHCTGELDVGCRQGALVVYRTAGEAKPLWPNVKTYNHAYDDAGMPAQATPVSPPPSPEPEPEPDPEPGEQDVTASNGNTTPDSGGDGSNGTGGDGTGQPEGDGTSGANSTPPPAGGGGGGDPPTAQPDPGPTPPLIAFGDDFPQPGSPHDPMAPLVVLVNGGDSPVVSVEMFLDDLPLEVEFDGEQAVHEPSQPLPSGNHLLIVRATDANGLTASVHRAITVLEPEPVDAEPRAPAEGEDEADGTAAATPVGVFVALAAIGVAALAAARSRRG